MTARKQPVTPEWIERMFGSARAWQKSRTGFRYVMVGRKRKPAIYCRLLPGRRAGWQLPCPDRPVPEHVLQAVGHAVTGVGERPRLEYEFGGVRKIGRAHVCTPVTNAHLVCRFLLEHTKYNFRIQTHKH